MPEYHCNSGKTNNKHDEVKNERNTETGLDP